ncbi:hypothetical protein, partial [Olsenella sp. AGMB03486]|uniref:hypothetical protein n=1 Tax=Olsenella sp. AGMB03486 TaxID=3230364 RepID=UPI0034A042AF
MTSINSDIYHAAYNDCFLQHIGNSMHKKPQIRAYRHMNIEAAEQCKQESTACSASMTHGLCI